MTAQTKFGLLVVMVFLIAIGMLLSRQVDRNGAMAEKRRDGLAELVPVQGESSEPRPGSGSELAGRREIARVDSGGGAAQSDRDRARGARIELEPGRSPHGREPGGVPPTPPRSAQAPLMDRPLDSGAVRADLSWTADRPVLDSTEPALAGLPPAELDLGLARIGSAELPPGWRIHKVASGETLGEISTRYYQTCRKYDLIFRANRDKLASPDRVQAGMELRIPLSGVEPAVAPPPAARVAPPSAPQAAPDRPLGSPLLERVDPGRGPLPAAVLGEARSIAAPAAWSNYRVRQGDTLSSIAAEKLGNRNQWQALWQANRAAIANPDVLPVGLVLRVPETRLAFQDR